MSTTKEKVAHTPGAIRCARELLRHTVRGELLWKSQSIGQVAGIIDRETAAPEMLEALERMRDKIHATLSQEANLKYAAQTLDAIDELAEAAIRKARGEE